MVNAANSRMFTFSDVEVRERQHRVTRAGKPLAIEPKAVRVLLYLLENAGHLVTKEELLSAVWGDTAVTDNSLTRAVALIRRVLEDDPHLPGFIETVSTAGYRFICPVQVVEEASTDSKAGTPGTAETSDAVGSSSTDSSAAPLSKQGSIRAKRLWMTASAALLVLAGSTSWYLHRPLPPPRITNYVQLTNDGRYKFIAGTDGHNLYLDLIQPPGIAMVPVSGGPLMELPIDLPESPSFNPFIQELSPDGSTLLATSYLDRSFQANLWLVGSHGSTARYLVKGIDAAWSPDNRTLVYSSFNGDLYTIPAEGGESRLIFASQGAASQPQVFHNLAWSPDGGRIRFVRQGRYWEISPDGEDPHEVLPNWHANSPKYIMAAGKWTPEGDFFLFTAWSSAFSGNPTFSQNLTTQIWALDERRSWLHKRQPEPMQLSSGASSWGTGGLAISKDGSKVYTTGISSRGELVVNEPKSNALKPFLGGISAEFVDFSKDGKHVVYVTYPEGVMWRANRDGTGLVQLTNPPLYPVNPRWSPDGTQIVFWDCSSSEVYAIYTITSQGGRPERLLSSGPKYKTDPDWSPDGKELIFTESAGTATSGAGQANRILELATGKIRNLPSSPRDFYSPRWSPDGRHIVGLATAFDALMLFDVHTKKWSMIKLADGVNCNWLAWSHDSRFIYFLNVDWFIFKSRDPGVYRISVTGSKLEKVMDLKGFSPAGFYSLWSGLDPDDNSLLLRNAGTREIYALTLGR